MNCYACCIGSVNIITGMRRATVNDRVAQHFGAQIFVMELLSSLQTDLRTLSAEARKKHANIKEVTNIWTIYGATQLNCKKAAERGILRLRSIEEENAETKNAARCAKAIGQSEDVLRPLLMACEQKGSKMVPMSVSTIHKLIVHNAVDPSSVSKITARLGPQVESSDESTQLKILQALLALVTTIVVHGDELRNILAMCFRLHSNRHSPVHNTAAAALRQLVTMLFDRANGEVQKKISSSPVQSASDGNLAPSTLDAYMLIQDIFNLTENDPSVWLEINSISTHFGLELIESLLHSHSILFLKVPEFSGLLKERLCPLIIKIFRSQTDFPTVVRIIRVITVFIRFFHQKMITECEVFLSRLIKMLDGSASQEWIQILALESLKTICENPPVLRSLCEHYDMSQDKKSAKIFHTTVNCIGQYINSMFKWDNQAITRSVAPKFKYMDLLSASEAPIINESYIVCISLDCLCGIISGMEVLVENMESSAEEKQIYPETIYRIDQNRSQEICTEMATQAWPTLLASLSLLLDKCNDEALTQEILKGYQAFIHICGTLKMATPRDAFLTSLCKNTLPVVMTNLSASSSKKMMSEMEGGESLLTPKNILSMKALFNIAHCMGGILKEGWMMVLDTFHQLDKILYTTKSNLATSGPGGELAGQSHELAVLSASLDLLFRNTDSIEDDSIMYILETLINISNQSATNHAKVRPLFGGSKIVEVVLYNVHRIQLFWSTISSYFIGMLSVKDSNTRNFAADSLTNIIQTCFSQKENIMQEKFLTTLSDMCKDPHIEIREKGMQTLYHILQTSGQVLNQGWSVVMKILIDVTILHSPEINPIKSPPASNATEKTVTVKDEKNLIGIALKSLQMICTDFLPNLKIDCMRSYISAVGHFGSQTVDLNIALTAINMIWPISDHISNYNPPKPEDKVEGEEEKEPPVELEDRNVLWIPLLQELFSLCTDKRSEVRNSAAQTLFKTISNHGVIFNDETWAICLDQIVFPVLNSVRECTINADDVGHAEDVGQQSEFKLMIHHSRNTSSKQWNETMVITMSGIARTFRSFLPRLLTLDGFPARWGELLSVLGDLMLFHSTEVSNSAVQCQQELFSVFSPSAAVAVTPNNSAQTIQTNGTNTSKGEDNRKKAEELLWAVSMDRLEAIGDQIFKRWRSIPSGTVLSIGKFYSVVYQKLHTLFSTEDHRRFIRTLRSIALHHQTDDAKEISPKIQDLVLGIFSQIPMEDEVYLYVVMEMIGYLSFIIGFPIDNTIDDQVQYMSPPTMGVFMEEYIPFVDRLMASIVQSFKSIPVERRNRTFLDIIKILGAAMMTKFSSPAVYQSGLWTKAITCFVQIVKTGIHDISVTTDLTDIVLNIIWTELIDCIQYFLVQEEKRTATGRTPEMMKRDDDMDVQLIDLLTYDVLSCSSGVPMAHERMIDLLMDGAVSGVNRDSFMEACYRNLFYLCSKHNDITPSEKQTATVVFPKLMERCQEVLRQVIAEDKKSGALPIARSRMLEVNIILKQLLDLEVEPIQTEGEENLKDRLLQGGKRHLFILFPVLTDCIPLRESEMRDSLSKLFRSASQEIGIQ
ncbi:protein hypothetical protein [Planoprotostelium fungivorum]|uniref:Protein MON2 homolog n=1 Tax=Planoprotostelium fungivorum TaxID=1890364 RepID=A0A2P6P0H6_9EUKA|nr:protein hypothetical protein [Planoprotostelium fungivorum]